jgi:IS605 OrfB family transposase
MTKRMMQMSKEYITLHHIKLYKPTNKKRVELNKLSNNWNKAIRSALKIVKHWGFTSYTRSHKEVYRVLRNNYNLPSQIAVEANRKAVESYKSCNKKFRNNVKFNYQAPVDLVKGKSFDFIKKDNGTSLVKINIEPYNNIYMPVCLSEYHLNYLNNDKYSLKTAELYEQNGEWYLNFVVSYETNIQETTTYMGIDLGIVNLATFSVIDNSKNVLHTEHFSGKKLRYKRMRYRDKRKSLSKKSDSVKTTLIAENRITKETNWLIANRIIKVAKKYNSTIIFEDLKHIRKNVTNDNSLNNYEKNSWAYYQLKQFVKHKANLNGLPVVEVKAYNTSQKCSACNHMGKRETQNLFECPNGHKFNADTNASINIAKLGMNKYNDLISKTA